MSVQIFELADVAAILGIEKSRVKNWTIGRPFSVQASVRASFGKGSRNLFSRNDVYCFALVERLIGVGTPVAAIQQMLEVVKPHLASDDFWKDPNWLLVNHTGRAALAYAISFAAESSANFKLRPQDEIGCFYGVNLRLLGDATSKKIETYIHQQTSGRLSVRKTTRGKTAIRRTR
jgi:hypothetical protein